MLDEDKYLGALAEMSQTDFNEKEWLKNNFELYKSTLNWPPNLPPINRSNLIKGTWREKFNSIYGERLFEQSHETINFKGFIEFK